MPPLQNYIKSFIYDIYIETKKNTPYLLLLSNHSKKWIIEIILNTVCVKKKTQETKISDLAFG